MTHQTVADSGAAVPADLVRLSCGVEAPEDLVADLRAAFAAAGVGTGGRRGRVACRPAGERLPLGRRAGDAVVAHRARGVGRRRLEALAEDPVGHLEDGLGDPVAVDLVGRQRDLRVVEDVEVGLARGVDVPRLARADRVERELDVLAQLGGASWAGRSCSR